MGFFRNTLALFSSQQPLRIIVLNLYIEQALQAKPSADYGRVQGKFQQFEFPLSPDHIYDPSRREKIGAIYFGTDPSAPRETNHYTLQFEPGISSRHPVSRSHGVLRVYLYKNDPLLLYENQSKNGTGVLPKGGSEQTPIKLGAAYELHEGDTLYFPYSPEKKHAYLLSIQNIVARS